MNPLPLLIAALCASCTIGPVAMQHDTQTDPGVCVVEQIPVTGYDEYHGHGLSRDGRLWSMSAKRGEDAEGKPIQDIFILNLVTGEQSPLPERINNTGHFSPDGEYLVVAAYDETGRTEILELHLATGDISIIAPHEQWDWLPSYSADGRYIVFNSRRHKDQDDIFVYERATATLQRVTDYDGYDAHAKFSSDDRKILFHRMNGKRDEGGYDFDLYLYDRQSETETRLTDSPFEESYPDFAPDGRHIVFSSDVGNAPEKHNLYVRAPDGEIARLTDGDWKDSYAVWSADGRYIYFNSDRSSVTRAYRIPMQGYSCTRNSGDSR